MGSKVARVDLIFIIGLLGCTCFAAGDLVRFVDNDLGSYLKHRGADVSAINTHDISAATAALLALHPSGNVDAATDAKLHALLNDDAFVRPQAVFAVTLLGVSAADLEQVQPWGADTPSKSQTRFLANSSALQLGQALQHLTGASPDSAQDLSLDSSRGCRVDAATVDEALEILAAASGASYERVSASASGKLTVTVGEGESVQLDLTKDAEYLLATELAHLDRAGQTLDFATNRRQLLTATLHGVQVVNLAYGPESKAASAATSLVLRTVVGLLKKLDITFQGKMVTVLSAFEDGPTFDSSVIAGRIQSAAAQRRQLVEAGSVPGLPGPAIIAAYVLTNKAVAWGVGILLIIFTIITVLALVCMPLTKDTLLYSRAKID